MADESPSVALSQDWKSCSQYTGVAVYEFPDAAGSKASARMEINNGQTSAFCGSRKTVP